MRGQEETRHGFAPGQSPLHVKGVLYRGTQEFFRTEVKGGMPALVAALAEEPLVAAFIQQSFLAASWYDVLPVGSLLHAEARAAGLPLAEYSRVRSAYQAKQDINGVYRFILKLVSSDKVAERLPRLIGQMFDFGNVETTILEEGHLAATISGFPAALADWIAGGFANYVETALRLAGADHARATTRPPRPAGQREGVPLVTVSMNVLYGRARR